MFNFFKSDVLITWKVPNQTDWHNWTAYIAYKYNKLHYIIQEELGPNGMYISALFVLFLLLIAFIYIKVIIDTFRSARHLEDKNSESGNDGTYIVEHNDDSLDVIANDNDDSLSDVFLSNEEKDVLQKERELSQELVEQSAVSDDFLHISEDYQKLKEKMQYHAEQEMQRLDFIKEEHERQKQESKRREAAKEIVNDKPLRPKINDVGSLITMILNMLGRNVSEGKIIQAIYYYYMPSLSFQDVISVVQTVRNFIGLCNAGRFAYLLKNNPLPSPKEALLSWAAGDSAKCLYLLQSLLNQQMDFADSEEGVIKMMTYAHAANCACIMGNIARLNDIDLAYNSFELATELSPRNVNAWNRLADIFVAKKNNDKAMIAYQNVLDIADADFYAEQRANAQKQLADYYLQQGVYAKSKQYEKESAEFYENYGIAAPLSEKEIIAFQTIWKNKNKNLEQSVEKLLNSKMYY
ncbi:MAG: hypothetical protein IJ525_06880 [Alphaproteobacteria bacterium]|nr:hypothetical protein [Alphaproteobacteria bacterium]